MAVYCRSFDAPFVFDDLDRIENNPAIRTLWPVWVPMATTNRPVGMLTFAVNYALGGDRVWGYHAVNLAIHIAAALLLWGIVRRTLETSPRAQAFRPAAAPLALAIALVWLVHPLQTESVTYVIQRLESLMGLCYLATLYGLVRAHGSRRAAWWYAGAVLSCALGMGTKEIMVTAPVVVLMFDRALLADSSRAILQRRKQFYLALAATWGVLAWSMLHWKAEYTSGLVGAVDQLSPTAYLLNQAGVLLHYLRLCVWPLGQCIDSAWPASSSVLRLAVPVACAGALVAGSLWALVRRPAAGFLGCAFFIILAPTSSIVPIHDLAVEHRLYLPLAAVITALVLAAYAASGWAGRRAPTWSITFARARPVLAGAAIVALALLTVRRNEVYRSPLALWQDTAAQAPHNARALCNLGEAVCKASQLDRGLELFRGAVEREPNYALAQYNLGTTYYVLGRYDEAAEPLLRAVELNPDYAEAHNNLGLVHCQRRQTLDGVGYLFRAVELQPENAKFQNALGTALYELGEYPAAIEHLERSIEIAADDAAAHYNLANALLADKQHEAASDHFRRTLQIAPEYEMAAYVHFGLGYAADALGRTDEAIAEYQAALRLKRDHLAAHFRLAAALAAQGQSAAAADEYRQVLALEPAHAGAARGLETCQTPAAQPLR